MSGIQKLLGDAVMGHESDAVSVESFSGKGKVVGLYFSAHWCPPCRGFTPVLKEFYEKIKKDPSKPFEVHPELRSTLGTNDRAVRGEEDTTDSGFSRMFEVVFLSSDRDAKSFQEYYAEMPWLAVPLGDARKGDLSTKYSVRGIPTLILLDGETGDTIALDGRNIVCNDPEAARFPWRS